MRRVITYVVLFFLLLYADDMEAQDLTGTWEGKLGDMQFLQLNVVHVRNSLCGYTSDHLIRFSFDSCAAVFTSRYDGKNDWWILTGTSFLANTGSHVLMRLVLRYEVNEKGEVLTGLEMDPDILPTDSFFSYRDAQPVYLIKVSDNPKQMLGNMKLCMDEKVRLEQKKNNKKKKPEKAVTTTPKPVKKSPRDISPVLVKPVDTSKKEIKKPAVPVLVVKDSSIVSEMSKRKNTDTKYLVVNVKDIVLEVYDNGIVDSDTVSVFYNNKLLLSHKRLSEKPIVIPITLDDNITMHEVVLFAENLGSIPPNTALVVVKAGDKRYELYASASLTENAVIRFEYQPR